MAAGAVTVDGEAIGYSPVGGTIETEKPDVLAYSQFVGSRISKVDDGTSTACPLLAGVVAAIRSRYPASQVTPAVLRDRIRASSGQRGPDGSWRPGPVDIPALLANLP
jgi:hypothetical protein